MRKLPFALAMLPLAACNPAPQANQAGAATDPAPPAMQGSASGVTRDEIAASPTPVAAPVQAAIQAQPATGGAQAALNKVAVTGDVLTVQLTYTGGETTNIIAVDQVSVIDDATAKQYGVLKDNAGKWLAAPVSPNGRQMLIYSKRNASIVWFKFPAPPATSQTVSINIPGTAPFDGVPVTR